MSLLSHTFALSCYVRVKIKFYNTIQYNTQTWNAVTALSTQKPCTKTFMKWLLTVAYLSWKIQQVFWRLLIMNFTVEGQHTYEMSIGRSRQSIPNRLWNVIILRVPIHGQISRSIKQAQPASVMVKVEPFISPAVSDTLRKDYIKGC